MIHYSGLSKLVLHNPCLSAQRSCIKEGVLNYSHHHESSPSSCCQNAAQGKHLLSV
jgi:hypothetical protein